MCFGQLNDCHKKVQESKDSLNRLYDKLLNQPYVTNIRLDFIRPEVYSEKKELVTVFIDPNRFGQRMKEDDKDPFKLFSLVMSAFSICIFKLTGASNIVLGVPSLKSKQKSPTIVPFAAEFHANSTFQIFAHKIKRNLNDICKYQGHLFDDLVKKLNLDKADNYCPLIDILVSYEVLHHSLPDYRNDIIIDLVEESKGLRFNLQFNPDLFRRDSMIHMLDSFERIIVTALKNPDIIVDKLIELNDTEKQKVLHDWNNSSISYPDDRCIHEIVEDNASRNPDAIAVVCDGVRMTYGELDNKANQLAHHLQRSGIGHKSIVGIFFDRSFEMIIGILGVLKIGAAYIPIDTAYPKGRIETMLEDAEALNLVLTKSNLADRLPKTEKKVILIDEDWREIGKERTDKPLSEVSPNDIVYIVFTSGSTGRPKGGAIYHKGWTNLLNWFIVEYAINDTDKCLVFSAFGFDITQRSLLMPLIAGGELHLYSPETYDPDLIRQNICENRITIVNCSPSTFYPLIENNKTNVFQDLSSLRYVFLGGEPISASRLKNWVESDACTAKVVNVYGVAECTDVSSSYCLVDYDRYIKSSVPAGKPIFNTSIYIVDEELRPLPIGVVGEICISSDGIGAGYINDENLNKRKYVSNPFSNHNNSRMYKTGDLGRYLPDGNIEFCGRMDRQIKLRGFRIELGEIESTIRQFPAVKEAIVEDWEFTLGDVRLICYIIPQLIFNETSTQSYSCVITPENQKALIDQLRDFSKKKLPNYMIPNVFMIIEKLPLNANGKLDRNALPKPDISDVHVADDELDYTTPTEKALTHIFLDALKIDRLGRRDDFFYDLGGYSLLATQVIEQIKQEFDVNLSQMMFFEAPTVAGLAEIIESNRQQFFSN